MLFKGAHRGPLDRVSVGGAIMATAQRGIAAVVTADDVADRQAATHDRELMLSYYREMLLIRRFEEKAGQLYGMGLIGGFCHLYIGQEAIAVGVQHALKDGDSVITAYRDHGHMLATGMDPRRVMAELTGRVTGYSKGKGGSMHMFARDKHFYGGHGIVGACVPLGTGIAFAHQYRDDGGVCVTYLGDGAVNQGQVYEAFNMAALWKLPVVYVIENNKYGMGTSVERASAGTELYRRGDAYGISGKAIDGMDVLAVREAAAEAVAHARAKGPTIVEALTYRYRGHSMSDPAKYRSRQEVQEMRTERDPIDRLRKTMLDGGLAEEETFKAIDKEIRAIVNEAASFAQDSPEPGPEELYKDVYLDV
jgi:pyruvate dehydrogenase E1 component alpha subunit